MIFMVGSSSMLREALAVGILVEMFALHSVSFATSGVSVHGMEGCIAVFVLQASCDVGIVLASGVMHKSMMTVFALGVVWTKIQCFIGIIQTKGFGRMDMRIVVKTIVSWISAEKMVMVPSGSHGGEALMIGLLLA